MFVVNDNEDVDSAGGGQHWSLLVYYRYIGVSFTLLSESSSPSSLQISFNVLFIGVLINLSTMIPWVE